MHSGSHIYDYIHHVCTGLLLAPLFCYVSPQTVTVIWIVTLIVWLLVGFRRDKRWRTHIGGEVTPGFEKVRDVFHSLLASRQERGGAFCVYYKGVPVVDLWGGYADYASHRLRTKDSTQMFYSATKAVTAITMAVLVDRGLLDYDAHISKYWPEFATKGKENIDVKTLMSHQAGLIAIRKWHKLALVRDDPTEMGRLLADEEPMWPPGTGQGYHTLTFGLYADQLVRRVDPYKRSLAKFFDQEIAKPFGLEIWIGEPREQFHRACRETRAYFGWRHLIHTVIPTSIKFCTYALYSFLCWGKLYLLYFVGNPTDWLPRRLNDPDYRSVPSPASHGYGTAHSMAKLMAMVAGWGELRGQRLFSRETCGTLATKLTEQFDRVVLRKLAYGPGLMIEKIGVGKYKDETCLGHWGAGGQMVYADLKRNLAWAYCTNHNNMLHGFIMDHRYVALKAALYECMEEIEKAEE